ncbi:MAG: hypothetical protein ACFB22_02785 [Rhodothalassiaceae bacterium]
MEFPIILTLALVTLLTAIGMAAVSGRTAKKEGEKGVKSSLKNIPEKNPR